MVSRWLLFMRVTLCDTVVAGFFAAGACYVVWAFFAKRGASCGCFGSATAVSFKTVARSLGLCGLACGVAIARPGHFPNGVSWAVGVVILFEVGLLTYLSDELDILGREVRLLWRVALYRVRNRKGPRRFVDRLMSTEVWRELSAALDASGRGLDFVDEWRDGQWAFAEFSGTWRGSQVSVVGGERHRVVPSWLRFIVLLEGSPLPSENRSEDNDSFHVLAAWDSVLSCRARRQGKADGLRWTPLADEEGANAASHGHGAS